MRTPTVERRSARRLQGQRRLHALRPRAVRAREGHRRAARPAEELIPDGAAPGRTRRAARRVHPIAPPRR